MLVAAMMVTEHVVLSGVQAGYRVFVCVCVGGLDSSVMMIVNVRFTMMTIARDALCTK